jgi:MoaA/NifB/PqqE/SkfB family radical SAM enzyme
MAELTLDEIRQLIEAARRIGIMEIWFFGGEPLLREDLCDLVRIASSKGLVTNIFTNGLLLNQTKVREFKKAGISNFMVSLDSISPEQHDKLRNYEGCFEKTLEGIKHVVDAGIRCSIWTYVKKDDVQNNNLADLKGIIDMGHHLNVYQVFILFPCASGNWRFNDKYILNQEEREKVRDIVRTYSSPPFVQMEFPNEDSTCNATRNFIYVNPAGNVAPCPAVDKFYGNIRQGPFSIIIEKMNKEFVESRINICGECIMNVSSSDKKIDKGISMSEKSNEISPVRE